MSWAPMTFYDDYPSTDGARPKLESFSVDASYPTILQPPNHLRFDMGAIPCDDPAATLEQLNASIDSYRVQIDMLARMNAANQQRLAKQADLTSMLEGRLEDIQSTHTQAVATKMEEIEEWKRVCKTKEQSNNRYITENDRYLRELMGVLARKYDIKQVAEQEIRREMAAEEAIKRDLTRLATTLEKRDAKDAGRQVRSNTDVRDAKDAIRQARCVSDTGVKRNSGQTHQQTGAVGMFQAGIPTTPNTVLLHDLPRSQLHNSLENIPQITGLSDQVFHGRGAIAGESGACCLQEAWRFILCHSGTRRRVDLVQE